MDEGEGIYSLVTKNQKSSDSGCCSKDEMRYGTAKKNQGELSNRQGGGIAVGNGPLGSALLLGNNFNNA